jgi:hypothetical protein
MMPVRVILSPPPSEPMSTRSITALASALLLPLALAVAGPIGPSKAAESTLTNGCTVSARGLPSCGAYVGATYKANADPTAWENSMGKGLGVRRTFWGSSVNSAVTTAKADVSKNRIPWMSFRPPYSWTDMAAGRGDAWARDLATKMSAVPGPVWVAVAHEPENDGGDMQKWKAMQARLAPIMRAAAPNLGYSIILMGYHQLYGDAKYSLANTWPDTKIDIAGFDVYEKYGWKGFTTWTDYDGGYFPRFQAWAKSKGVAWGLAETGYNDPAARASSTWMSGTYNALVANGGIAFSYFNTTLNSKTSWALTLATKQAAFTAVNKPAPTQQ